ncbi:DDE transposase family protein [Acinetobacter larvae]|uniref:DDE transposase family protein n=1 Tax=Acinetobacter larvae TaxID=1789224 RepID=A0A1B2M2Z8_9GAMM|nr:DDE transposase family protein [Acinetobacter larvae]
MSWSTFNLMMDELRVQLPVNTGKGRPPKLPLEDRLLLCLEYWREYRTLFHVGMNYGVSETSALRTTRKIEDILIKSGKFSLPKQMPDREEANWDVVVVDATEIFVQRPKKTEKMV